MMDWYILLVESHWIVLMTVLFLDLEFKSIILHLWGEWIVFKIGGQETRTMRLLQLSGEE